MIIKPRYFDLDEIVCPHIFFKYGEMAWQFFDTRQLVLLDWIREKLGPMFANNWHSDFLESDYIKEVKQLTLHNIPIYENAMPPSPYQLLDERGLRCNLCSINLAKVKKGCVYVSAHLTGQATDFDVKRKTAEEVRQWLSQNQDELPYPIRLESGTMWVHEDCRDGGKRITLVNPY